MNARNGEQGVLNKHVIAEKYTKMANGQANVARMDGELKELREKQKVLDDEWKQCDGLLVILEEKHNKLARIQMPYQTLQTIQGLESQRKGVEATIDRYRQADSNTESILQVIDVSLYNLKRIDEDLVILRTLYNGQVTEAVKLLQGITFIPNFESVKANLQRNNNDLDAQKEKRVEINSQYQAVRARELQLVQQLQEEETNMQQLLADEYVNALWNHPELLVEGLIRNIRQWLASYERSHPVSQDYPATVCVLEIERGVDFIEARSAEDPQERRNKYYELVGLLQNANLQLANDCNQRLRREIQQLLEKHVIDKNEALDAYRDLCHSNLVGLPEPSPLIVTQRLEKCYAAARQRVLDENVICQQRNAQWKSLGDAGVMLLNEIACEKARRHPDLTGEFDIIYYTTILKSTADVMRDPQNADLRKQYHELTNSNQLGKASIPHKIAGAVMVVLGVAVMFAPLMAGAMSAGLSAPLSFGSLLAGGAVTLLGVGLFSYGSRRGVAKAMDYVELAADAKVPNERTSLLLLM